MTDNEIEKLANSEFEYIATHNKYLVSLQELTKFAQILQQSEPVAYTQKLETELAKCRDAFKIGLVDNTDAVSDPLQVSEYVALCVADMQAKLDKAREALQEIANIHVSGDDGFVLQGIAQQALKEIS